MPMPNTFLKCDVNIIDKRFLNRSFLFKVASLTEVSLRKEKKKKKEKVFQSMLLSQFALINDQ